MTVIRINGSSTGNQPQGSDVQSDVSLALNDLTNVDATTNLANNSIIKYNSTASQWQVGSDTDTGIAAVVDDLTPQLGGNLDVNNKIITNDAGQYIQFNKPISISSHSLFMDQTDSSAAAGPTLSMHRISSSPNDDDLLGQIKFEGKNSAMEPVTYSSITGRIGNKNDGSERGLINFNAIDNGSDQLIMSMSRKGLFMGAGHVLALGGDSANFFTSLYATDPTANRTITFPDASGTVIVKDSSDQVVISKADDGAGSGPDIILSRVSASPDVGDQLGSIQFKGQDSAGNADLYASIQGEIERTTSGGERGRIDFNVIADGSNETVATLNRNGLFFSSNNKIAFAGTTDNNNFVTLQAATDPAGFRTIGLPDSDGTVMLNLVEDTTPQLGDHLDVNGKKITSVSDGDIELEPNGSGKIILDGSIDIEGDRANSNSLFINNDMSSNLADDLHNTIECQSDYTGTNIGTGTRQQSITLSFKDDTATRQAGRFNCEYTVTDPSANKMKLIAIDYAGSPSNGQIDITPKRGAINVPFELKSYAVASLPTSGIGAGAMAYCTDETGGAVPCFYDGSNWRRVTDRAVAS